MTKPINVNQIFESALPALLPEEPFRAIPLEIVEFILTLTNDGENTRLVSRIWKDLTFPAAKNSNSRKLQQTIFLIAKNLNPNKHAQWITDLAEIQDTYQSHSKDAATFAKVQRLFLTNKGLVIGVLRKLSVADRNQLPHKIGEKLPESMKDIFKISRMKLTCNLGNLNLEEFFTLLQSCQPLSLKDREDVFFAVRSNADFVKLLLADGPHTILMGRYLGCGYNSTFIKSLLAHRLNSEEPLVQAFCEIAHEWSRLPNCIEERIKLLLDLGSISEKMRGEAVLTAIRRSCVLQIIKLLLANGPISKGHREEAVRMVDNIICNPYGLGCDPEIFFYKEECLRFLLEKGPISEKLREEVLSVHPNQETVNLLDSLFGFKITEALTVTVAALRKYLWYCSCYFLSVIFQRFLYD